MYGTIADGPGAMVIVDVPPSSGVAAAITAVVASSDGVQNVKSQRLFSMEEITAIRKKPVELQASYTPPGPMTSRHAKRAHRREAFQQLYTCRILRMPRSR
jgi:hypothetical protein